MRNRRSTAGVFRVIAGGYLVYLGVKLIRDGILTGEMQGSVRLIGVLASILFILFGAGFAVHAIRFMMKNSGQEEGEQEEEIAEAESREAQEQAAAAPSLFDRAGFGALDEGEEDETQI